MKEVLLEKRYEKIYSIYKGQVINLMSELKRNENPLSIANYMDLRNDACKLGKEDRIQQICYNSFVSGDSAVYHPDGRIKIVWDSPNLRNLTPKSKLRKIGYFPKLNLEKEKKAKRFAELPEEINGVQLIFNPKEIKEFIQKRLKAKQVLKNKFCLALARGDENKLEEYIQNVYSRNKEPEIMGVWISDYKPDFEFEEPWSIDTFDVQRYFSLSELGDSDDRLIGLEKV